MILFSFNSFDISQKFLKVTLFSLLEASKSRDLRRLPHRPGPAVRLPRRRRGRGRRALRARGLVARGRVARAVRDPQLLARPPPGEDPGRRGRRRRVTSLARAVVARPPRRGRGRPTRFFENEKIEIFCGPLKWLLNNRPGGKLAH